MAQLAFKTVEVGRKIDSCCCDFNLFLTAHKIACFYRAASNAAVSMRILSVHVCVCLSVKRVHCYKMEKKDLSRFFIPN